MVGKTDFNENPVVSLYLDFDVGFVNSIIQTSQNTKKSDKMQKCQNKNTTKYTRTKYTKQVGAELGQAQPELGLCFGVVVEVES